MKIGRNSAMLAIIFVVGMLTFVLKTEVVAQPLPVPVTDLSEGQLGVRDVASPGFSQIAAGGVSDIVALVRETARVLFQSTIEVSMT